MLDAEKDPEHERAGEESDYLRTVPGIDRAAEGDGHDAGDRGADYEEKAEVVDFAEALADRDRGLGVRGWEEEDVGGGEDPADAEVDVEGPAPGRAAICEGAADDGT